MKNLQQRLQDVCDILNFRKIVPIIRDDVLVNVEDSEFYIAYKEGRNETYGRWIVLKAQE